MRFADGDPRVDSVISIQPIARPCTPAAGMYTRRVGGANGDNMNDDDDHDDKDDDDDDGNEQDNNDPDATLTAIQ